MNEKIASLITTQSIMEKYNIKTKKSLGQNFLVDSNVINKIAKIGNISKEDNIIEIGPGIGALTEILLKSSKNVIAFEIDTRFIKILTNELNQFNNLTIINKDILKSDLKAEINKHFNGNNDIKIIANLPYYITTAIIIKIIKLDIKFKNIVIMMQKEVAERLIAKKGTKQYGSLSLLVQYKMNVEIALEVNRKSFMPQPNVDSSVVKLDLNKTWVNKPQDEKKLLDLFRIGFVLRRKTLWNNLLLEFGKKEEVISKLEKALKNANIDPKIRAEKLSIEEFIILHNELFDTGIYE